METESSAELPAARSMKSLLRQVSFFSFIFYFIREMVSKLL